MSRFIKLYYRIKKINLNISEKNPDLKLKFLYRYFLIQIFIKNISNLFWNIYNY